AMPDKPEITVPEKVEFVTKYDQGYSIVGCNGIFGGITARGDIKMDFFQESQAIPDLIVNKVLPDGSLAEEIERHPQLQTVRLMRVSVLMTSSQIPVMINWLQEKLAFMERLDQEIEKLKGKGNEQQSTGQ